MFMVLLALLVIITVSGYARWIYGYWQRRRVVFVTGTFPFGSLTQLFTKKKYIGDIYAENYRYFLTRGERYGGVFIFTSPALVLVDPELVKDVMTKNFHIFNDRGFYCNEKYDPLSAHLLNLTGERWKRMRGKLTTAFTPAKVKIIFETVLGCSVQLLDALEECLVRRTAFDADEVMACFTTDVISSCAFGLECNSFKEPHCEFRQYGDEIMRPPMSKVVLLALGEMNKKLANLLGVTRTTSSARTFFLKIVSDTIAYRNQHQVFRKDFMQILMNLKNESDGLTLPEVAAQALLFFVAGFETSASTLTFCLYELAKHPQIQQRLREEVRRVWNDDQALTYDAINNMPYLTQVIDEALRKYPPAGVVARKCLKDYKLPHSNLIVHSGTKVLVSIQGLHHNPCYFPEPDIFDPERFNENNRLKIIPYTYLPFGEGPRSCIGAKFGIMQAKIGLVTMLKKFKFTLNSKTPKVLKPYYGTISLTFPKTVWLNVENIKI